MVTFAQWRPASGVKVIPDGWEATHEPIALGTMTATVRVWSGPQGGAPELIYDPAIKEERLNRGVVLHEGPARIQQRSVPAQAPAGGQQVTTHEYLVTCPKQWDDITPEAWVEVLTSSDGQLVGDHRWLHVIDVFNGSLRWERDLICTIDLG